MNFNSQPDTKTMRKGFTLVELLVAVSLSGVIFLGVSSLMITMFQSNARVRQIDRIEQAKNDIVIELTNAIRWAKAITFEVNAVEVLQTDNTRVTYSFQTDRLYKGTSPITPTDVVVTNFVARNVGASSSLPLVEISLDVADKQFPTVTSRVRFVVSQRVSSVTTAP